MGVVYPTTSKTNKTRFHYDIFQKRWEDGATLGGVSYDLFKPDCSDKVVTAGNVVDVGRGCKTTLVAQPKNQCSVYRWTDELGNELSTESDLEIMPVTNRTYSLTTVSVEGCISVSQTKVNVNSGVCNEVLPGKCFSNVVISPNPSQFNTFNIKIESSSTNARVNIVLRSVLFGNVIKKMDIALPAGGSNISVDILDVPKGLYQIEIYCAGMVAPGFTELFSRN